MTSLKLTKLDKDTRCTAHSSGRNRSTIFGHACKNKAVVLFNGDALCRAHAKQYAYPRVIDFTNLSTN